MTAFLDTNVILRHLLADHPTLSPAAREILRQVEDGELEVWTSDLAIAEIVFVLSNRKTYGFARVAISTTASDRKLTEFGTLRAVETYSNLHRQSVRRLRQCTRFE